MGSGRGRSRRVQSAEVNPERSARLAAYHEVLKIVDSVRSSKLHDNEADTILMAAEDVLLSADTEEAKAHLVTFEGVMDDLETHRWLDMVGTDAEPGTALRLRRAFAACAPAKTPALV